MKRKRHAVVVAWIIAASALTYVAIGGAMFALERPLVYGPDPVAIAPAAVGLASAQVLDIPTSDGEHLVAWFVPAAMGAPLALFFHGSGGSLADRVDQIERLGSFGFAVLAIDYRGFGGSTGSPSEEGLTLDAEAALHRAGELGYETARIVVVGQSLGTGVATALAARHRVAGLLLDSSFASLVDIAAERYPAFPVRWFMRDRFQSDRVIAAVHAPVLLLHGDADRIVPPRHGERLFRFAAEPKAQLTVPGAGHCVLGEKSLTTALGAWFDGLGLHRPAL